MSRAGFFTVDRVFNGEREEVLINADQILMVRKVSPGEENYSDGARSVIYLNEGDPSWSIYVSAHLFELEERLK